MTSDEYQLSATLVGHESDVRAVLSPVVEVLYTASRDTTVRQWSRTHLPKSDTDPTFGYETTAAYLGHTKYVNSLAYLPANAMYPQGLILSGGSDRTIRVFDTVAASEGANEPIFTLTGHTDNVCALTVAPNGDIISGSWDNTARIWRNWQCIAVLKGHTYAVWAVLGLNDGTVLTASADKLIKRWRHDQCIATYQGHTEAVRGLTHLAANHAQSQADFASCANDGTLRLWNLADGHCVRVLEGHTSFVYTLCSLATGELASGGEDRSVKIWRDGACIQTITLPAQSIWSVAASPNGDLVAGTSDKEAHVFTRVPERHAPASVRAAYDNLLAERQAAEKAKAEAQGGEGGIDEKDLSPPSTLQRPGTKDGQVVMVKNARGAVMAHQWEAASHQWTEVGTVMDAIGADRRQLYEGKEYDYVFSVDVRDGAPPLQLPYNRGENVYTAAQAFLDRHDLPPSYLDQVAQFITTNAGEEHTRPSAAGGGQEYVDPFTGAARYVPQSGENKSVASTIASDPFTGANRYQASSVTSNSSPTPMPAISGGGNSFPVQVGFVSLKQCNVTAVVDKVRSLNATVSQELPSAALSENQLATLADLGHFLTARTAESPGVPGSPLTDADRTRYLNVLQHIALDWPFVYRFPALDLLRLLACFTPLVSTDSDTNGDLLAATMTSAELDRDRGLLAMAPTRAHLTQLMLAARVLANSFATPAGATAVWQRKDGLMDHVVVRWGALSSSREITEGSAALLNPCRLALATLLLNLTVFLTTHTTHPDPEYATQLFTWLVELAEPLTKLSTNPAQHQETLYRSLVALGTLLARYPELKDAAQVFGLHETLDRLVDHAAPQVARTATSLLQHFGL
ncbi:WD repeat protein Lub1 [Tieghemiomyces parasiticus]|uniref:WD repeat protein Lub1 n=1 Tax=Tieghemiomyces parasiticus TaxID=78921 RepID=A0A9W8AEF0_9FUNG|nr:WD repeat protein Lub1 [Tieghemiomyces parasiticus]